MADPGRTTLPLPDYDHLPLGGLESRVRPLTAEEVEELLATSAPTPTTLRSPKSSRRVRSS